MELDKDYPDVVIHKNITKILLELREDMIKRSPLPDHLIGEGYQKDQDPNFEYNGLSSRSILRIISNYIGLRDICSSKKEALIQAIKENCASVFITQDPDNYGDFDEILERIINKYPLD